MPNSDVSESDPSSRASRAKRRRRRIRIAIAIVIAVLFYPVVGTLALWTGLIERFVASEDLEVEIENPAWTIWPGHIHARSARILVNGETQFILSAERIRFHVDLLDLLEKTLHVTWLTAEDVKYQMRVQVESTKGIEERLAAYPKLEGLPGDNTVVIDKAHKTEEREGDFTIDIEDIDVKVSELWFMEYRYLGDGTLKGAFLVGPGRMRVKTSVQELGPGNLYFGEDKLIAERFGGRVEATVPEVDPEKHADASFLELVTADIALDASVVSLEHLGAYLDGIEVTGGSGPFSTHLFLAKGHLDENSVFTFRTDKIRVQQHGLGVETDWDLDARVTTERSSKPADKTALPRIRSKSKATYVSFSNEGGKIFTIQAHDHHQEVVLRSNHLGGSTDLKQGEVHFPTIITDDLDDVSAVTGEKTPAQAKKGAVRASLFLDIDEKHVARGPFELDFDDVRLIAAGVRLGGTGKAKTNVRIDLDDEATTLGDLAFKLTDGSMHVGDEHVEDWWMTLSSNRVGLWGFPPSRIECEIVIKAKDAEPVLESLAEKDKLNDLIAKFTSLDDFEMRAELRRHGDVTDILIDSMESSVWDAAGRIRMNGKSSQMALVIGGKAVSLGIASDGSGTTFKPFARSDWLNEKLRKFPKPVETVRSPAP